MKRLISTWVTSEDNNTMFMRNSAATVFFTLLLSLPAAGNELPAADNTLAAAAGQMKLKNYSSAARLAIDSPESGRRDLLAGIAELKRRRYDEASSRLAKAAKSYPLLADYALYYQAEADSRSGRRNEAIAALKTLLKEYPESPLARRAHLREGDLLFDTSDYLSAEAVYQKFVEKYAAGSDALQASYKSAVCRDKRGDATGAAAIFRSIWLNSPTSPLAAKAEEDLRRLPSAAVPPASYSPQELFKRGTSLYDQRRYESALATFRSIDAGSEKKEFRERLSLKIGKTLLKLRRYQDAGQSLKALASSDAKKEIRAEASYLLARTIEKSGRDEDAIAAYRKVAADFPDCAEADDSLMDAAFVRKFQNRPADVVLQLGTLLENYPKTALKQRAIWETGWAEYLAGNKPAAAEQFRKLFTSEEYRERALYWHARAAASSGDAAAAAEDYANLRKEYPFGFYALRIPAKQAEPVEESVPDLTADPKESLPLPEGFERVKALISLGLMEDAGTELASVRKKSGKGKPDSGLARLYLELGNHNAAMSLYNSSMLKRSPDSRRAWSFLYPRAFGDLIQKYSEKAGVDPSLAFAVMRAESSFSPAATSPVGARGLMQLMPHTAALVLHEKKIDPDRLYDPELNIRLGTKHLRELIDSYNGNLVAVIASYNAGAHNVNRWMKTYTGLQTEEFIESIPFGETRDYVKKVLASADLYKRLYSTK
jgi:peptidoglycan lytic transglycosylase